MATLLGHRQTKGTDQTSQTYCYRATSRLYLTVTEAAAQLGVTRATLSRVLNGRAAISPEMALRLEGWLGVKNGGRADLWISMQTGYDLWQARKAGAPKVKRALALTVA